MIENCLFRLGKTLLLTTKNLINYRKNNTKFEKSSQIDPGGWELENKKSVTFIRIEVNCPNCRRGWGFFIFPKTTYLPEKAHCIHCKRVGLNLENRYPTQEKMERKKIEKQKSKIELGDFTGL